MESEGSFQKEQNKLALKDAFLELLEDAIDKGGDGSFTVLFLVGKGGGGVESSYNDGLEVGLTNP